MDYGTNPTFMTTIEKSTPEILPKGRLYMLDVRYESVFSEILFRAQPCEADARTACDIPGPSSQRGDGLIVAVYQLSGRRKEKV